MANSPDVCYPDYSVQHVVQTNLPRRSRLLGCSVSQQEGNQSPVLKLPVSWAYFRQACPPPAWPNLRDFRSAYTGQRLLSWALQRQETHSKLTMNMDRCMFTQKSWEDASRQPAWKDQRQKGGMMRVSLGLPDGQSSSSAWSRNTSPSSSAGHPRNTA